MTPEQLQQWHEQAADFGKRITGESTSSLAAVNSVSVFHTAAAKCIADMLTRVAVNVEQIVYALERAARRLEAEADALSRDSDYSAEFPAEDAARMREAIALLSGGALASPAEPDKTER